MPPAAFVAVPRLPHPPFESQLLLPVGMTELMTKFTLQSTLNYCDNNNEDTENLHDYQQPAITSCSPLLQHCSTEDNEQLM